MSRIGKGPGGPKESTWKAFSTLSFQAPGASEVAQFSLENWLGGEGLKFFGACGGPSFVHCGMAEFLRGRRAKKSATFVDKSAKNARAHADPAILGLGPLLCSIGELCLPGGGTQARACAARALSRAPARTTYPLTCACSADLLTTVVKHIATSPHYQTVVKSRTTAHQRPL